MELLLIVPPSSAAVIPRAEQNVREKTVMVLSIKSKSTRSNDDVTGKFKDVERTSRLFREHHTYYAEWYPVS
jgi:hypothetical protein